jgi:hypothetical protein
MSTRNIVPRATGEGGIGTNLKKWGSSHIEEMSFNSLYQRNRLDADMTIPDGYNSIRFGDFEIAPGVTITLLGNAQLVVI